MALGKLFKDIKYILKNPSGNAKLVGYDPIKDADFAINWQDLINAVKGESSVISPTVSNSGNSYVSNSVSIVSYIEARIVLFKPSAFNTGLAYYNINGFGSLPIRKFNGTSIVNTVANDLNPVNTYLLLYKTSYWLLIETGGRAPVTFYVINGNGTTTLTLTHGLNNEAHISSVKDLQLGREIYPDKVHGTTQDTYTFTVAPLLTDQFLVTIVGIQNGGSLVVSNPVIQIVKIVQNKAEMVSLATGNYPIKFIVINKTGLDSNIIEWYPTIGYYTIAADYTLPQPS